MSPVGIGTSDSTYALATGKAKLWILLVGVNKYQDPHFPPLEYSAVDCQGLGEALTEATGEFPQKQVIIHHDFAAKTPTLKTVRASLEQIISAAKPQDTVLFYFSGHGVQEPESGQAVLCLSDTQKDALLDTALGMQEVLQMLGSCAARAQLVWLDACHSGSMTLRGSRGAKEFSGSYVLNEPTAQLVKVLRVRASKSKGFYALLSCDQGQRSWEFPDLGHGLFTYYLMRGLRGEAADPQGVIEADGLYKYVYHQTLQYIEQRNQQLRLLNQQKRLRGETPLYPEYPLQTPKRIVEGVGELVLGLKSDFNSFLSLPRTSISPESLSSNTSLSSKEITLTLAGLTQDGTTQTSGEPTVVSTQRFLELNNQGQILRFCLEEETHQVGRDRKWSDLNIPDKGWEVVSRHQAILRKEGDDYRIYDGDGENPSRNGIFINHTRINSKKGYLLNNGATLEIGQDPHNQILLTYFNPAKNQGQVLPSKRRLVLRDLHDWPVVLGREQQLDYYSSMQLDSPTVSRRHAMIYQASRGGYRLENYSTNGTFVNGKLIERAAYLQDGDRIQIGPFALLYFREVLEIVDRGNQIRLDAHNLKRQVKNKELGDQLILDDVSLAIEPGQMVALVGGSGAGKSTLMKTLLGIAPTTSGTVFLNGDDLRQNFDIYRAQIGYVPQDDIVHRDLSVEEVLTYACKLRLPPDTEVEQVVKRTLSQIMLSHVKNSFVRDLSGGQRKRVSIGVELLANPKLFFLDEPTSGLDPGLDKEIMQLLRELAQQGRTVVLVTHATANIEECDRIAFMGRGGKLCYFGPPKDALNFFEMPSEDLKYFADIYRKLDQGTIKKDTQHTVNYWAKKFQSSKEYKTYIEAALSSGKPNPSKTTPQKLVGVSFWQQLLLLSERYLQLVRRDRLSLALSLLTGSIGILLIILSLQDQTVLAGIDSPEITQASLALRVLFVFSCVAIWVGLSSSVQEIVKESAIYARERLVNLGLLPYVGSKFLPRLAIAILQTVLIALVILFGFEAPASKLISWPIGLAITNFLTLISSISLGLMLSAFVKNENEANNTLPLVMIPQIIFSGVLFNLKGIASKIAWLMPSRWSVGAYGSLVDVNSMIPKLPQVPGAKHPLQPLESSPVYDPTWHNLSLNWAMLCLHAVVYLAIALYLQKRKDVI